MGTIETESNHEIAICPIPFPAEYREQDTGTRRKQYGKTHAMANTVMIEVGSTEHESRNEIQIGSVRGEQVESYLLPAMRLSRPDSTIDDIAHQGMSDVTAWLTPWWTILRAKPVCPSVGMASLRESPQEEHGIPSTGSSQRVEAPAGNAIAILL